MRNYLGNPELFATPIWLGGLNMATELKQRRVRVLAQMPTKGLFAFLFALFLFSQALSAANWTIDGDRVYWTGNNYQISAAPATSAGAQHTQYINISSTNPTSRIANFSFVFSQAIQNAHAYYWRNYSHNVKVPTTIRANLSATFNNVSANVSTTEPCQVGDSQNTFKRKITTNTSQVVVCYNSFSQNGNSFTAFYQLNSTSTTTAQQWFYDWDDISANFQKTIIGGKTIFTYPNVQLNNGDNHQVKFYYETMIGVSGKYDIYVHSGTPQQVANGQALTYLILDPWFNTSYGFRYPINCSNENYGMPVVLNGTNGIILNGTNLSIRAVCQPDLFLYYNNATSFVVANNTSIVSSNATTLGMNEQWTMDNDYVGNQNGIPMAATGAIANASGIINNSVSMAGGMYLLANGNSLLGHAGGSTYCFWAYPTAVDSSWHIFFSRAQNTIYSGISDGNAFYTTQVGGGTINDGTPTANIWYHLCLVEYTNSTLTFYINGSVTQSTNSWVYNIDMANTPLAIGEYNGNNNNAGFAAAGLTYKGRIDEFQFWNRSLTTSEIGQLYNNYIGTAGYASLGALEVVPAIANFTFINQSPNDINTTNIMNGLNVTYNITGSNLNSTTAVLFTQVNNSGGACWLFINGTATCGYQPDGRGVNVSDTYTWQLEHDFITPTIAPLPTSLFENTAHSSNTLSSNNDAVKLTFKNVTNTTTFNTIMAMVNSTSNASLSLRIYYCNSSYTTGDFVTSPNCAQATTLNGTKTFTTIENNSKYNMFSGAINITSGTFGGVRVTPLSYLIMQGRNGVGNEWFWFSIPNVSTANTTQTTSNSGVGWANFAGTFDAHLHQFSTNDTVCYYPQINDTLGGTLNSTARCDLIEQGNMPPSTPAVFSPINTTYYKDIANISINYTQSVSPNLYPIVQYNITLRNSTTDNFILTIMGNNSPNLSFSWNASAVPDGQYNVHVEARDSLNQTSVGESNDFTLITTPIPSNVSFTSPTAGRFYLENATINLSFNATNFRNCTLDINGTNFSMPNLSSTLCQYNITSVGNFTIIGYVENLAGNITKTSPLSFQTFNITSVTPMFSNPEYDLLPDNISLVIVTDNYFGVISGNLTYNSTLSALSVGQSGTTFTLSKVITPIDVTTDTEVNLTWRYLFANASLNYTIANATNITNSGLFECGNITNSTSFNITYLDESLHTPLFVNDTLQISYLDFAGRGITFNATNVSYHAICIFPPNLSLNISLFVTANSAQHFQKTQTLTINISNATQNITIFLTSSLTSAFYTFQTINVYNAPIAGSNITLERLNQVTNQYEVVQSGTTDITGSLSVPLQQFISYRMNITSTGYNFESFFIVPASQTTIQIVLTQNTTTNIQSLNAFGNVYYNITPAAGYYNTSKTLTFFVQSNISNLESWGMYITITNGSNVTKVFDQTSTNAAGGTLSYVANPSKTYVVYGWFKASNNTNFTIAPVYYFINNQSVGLAWVRNQLSGDRAVSGWTFYFIALAVSVCIGIGINRLMGVGTSAAALGALVCLTFFSLLAPPNMVIFGILTPFMATVLIGAVTLAVIYLTHYGA